MPRPEPARWASEAKVGEEVLVLCRFPQLENSQFFATTSNFQIEGLETPTPSLLVDEAWRFKGRHMRPMTTNLFFHDEVSSSARELGTSPHVVHFDLDCAGLSSRPERIRAPKHKPLPEDLEDDEVDMAEVAEEAEGVEDAGAADPDSAAGPITSPMSCH